MNLSVSRFSKNYISFLFILLMLFNARTASAIDNNTSSVNPSSNASSNIDYDDDNDYENDDNLDLDDNNDIYNDATISSQAASSRYSSTTSAQSSYNNKSSNSYNTQSRSTTSSQNSYTTPLLPKSGEVDNTEMDPNDWDFVLDNVNNNGDTFDFIKNNNSSSDNGKWMLHVGISMILLSSIGFLYLIISYFANKKKTNLARSVQIKNSKASPSKGRFQNINTNNYKADNKQTRRTSKYDTADVPKPNNKNSADWDKYFNN